MSSELPAVSRDTKEPGQRSCPRGWQSRVAATIDFEQARLANAGGRIEAFVVGPGFGPDLAYLVSLVAADRLDPQVGWRGGWERADDAAEALFSRQVVGKTVLDVE